MTATVVDPDTGSPEHRVAVTFEVTDGPAAGVEGRCQRAMFFGLITRTVRCETDRDGQVTWYYQYERDTGSQLGTDTIRATAALPGNPAATAEHEWLEPVDYGALGDSYSSGLGASPYFGEVPDCRRSRRAYATLTQPPGYNVSVYELSLDRHGDVSWRFVACQGAQTPEVRNREQFGEPPQVERVDQDVSLVTITIGGNDAGFGPILESCLWHACLDREWQDGQTLREWLPAKIASLRPVLADTYAEILAATGGAPMFVLGYPQVFPATEAEQGCFKLRPWRGEMDFFRDMGDAFDQVLAGATADAGVHFVKASDHFAGHEVCGEDGEWLNGPSLPLDHSFHPNRTGQAEYAALLNATMAALVGAGASTEPTGVPSNPGAGGFGMAAAQAEPLPTVGVLEVEPLESRPAEACQDVTRPGADVRLTGEGFAPGSPVSLAVEFDGQGADLGSVTATPDGTVDTVVPVPSSFDPPPVEQPDDVWQPETVAGFEAAGAAPDGSERLLFAAVGLSVTHLLCDIVPPSVELTAPQEGAVYRVGETVVADYTCADDPDGSGIAECVGDLPAGGAIDTSLPGTYRFTAAAVDRHGNATEATVTYTVDLPAHAVVDGGVQHSLAVAANGSVWAWGGNGSGQLGDGSTTSSTVPVRVTLEDAAVVAAGAYHSLAVAADGTARAWGAGNFGQLGDGGTANQASPVTVAGLDDVVAVAGGNYHSLAVTGDGRAWAWGYNGTGQLGDGTTTSRSTPVQVSNLDDVVAVAAGGIPGWSGHSLALRADGTVWAWGYNNAGQLGDGTRTHRTTPARVTGLDEVVWIAAGGDASFALRADGTVWAWGDNGYDQLGSPGTGRRSTVPVQAAIDDVAFVAAGGTHALAVRGDGSVWAWGNNNTGQLGHDHCGPGTPKTVDTPVEITELAGTAPLVAAGYVHSLAAAEALVWGWGRNAEGQVGDGTTTSRCAPVPVAGLPQ